MFTSSTKREIRQFHVTVVQPRRQREVQKSVIHVQSCSFANVSLLFFCRSCYNNNNSLLTHLGVKNWINSAIYNWILIIKSIYNNKYHNNNLNPENLKVKESFALFVLFIVVVVLVFSDLNWHGIDLVITCGVKKDMGVLSFLISAINFLHINILRSANDVKFAWSRACW